MTHGLPGVKKRFSERSAGTDHFNEIDQTINSTAGGASFIPGQKTKIWHATRCDQKKSLKLNKQ